MNICKDLLREWCEKLLEFQVTSVKNPALYGGILCPVCSRIHGRCFDAIYPFLYLADVDGDSRYLKAAKLLFEWAENTVSGEDGSYINDTNSEWKGTTVFSTIQLVEAMQRHGHLLDPDTYQKWKGRVARSAEFLYSFKEFEICNINYRITNALAMALCSEFLGVSRYAQRGHELISSALTQMTDNGILFGEGRPISGFSSRGCRSVDIGYNMEESLPAWIQYAYITGDTTLIEMGKKALKTHILFMLEDGGIDNSFGTRNYKWTYWGSRTSDGCALGYLLAAKDIKEFGIAAYKNLKLLKECTHDGFLYAGPHAHQIEKYACIHHSFSHAKVLAGILDNRLDVHLHDGVLSRMKLEKPVYFPELDTFLFSTKTYTATLTAYDWIYGDLKEGHASGGTLSLLWHYKHGLVLCGSMNRYILKEVNNMQLPRHPRHECLTPRIEFVENGLVYSSINDYSCLMSYEKSIIVNGVLRDINQNTSISQNLEYQAEYIFEKEYIHILVNINCAARFIIPIVSGEEESITWNNSKLDIQKKETQIILTVQEGCLELPYGNCKIYNLVPGVEAVKSEIRPRAGRIAFSISF